MPSKISVTLIFLLLRDEHNAYFSVAAITPFLKVENMMRIETATHVLLNASTIKTDTPDDFVIRVIATGLDHRGETLSVTIKLTRNELMAINRAAAAP